MKKGLMRVFFGERMENDRISKRVYVGECAGSSSVGLPRERALEQGEGVLIRSSH